MTQISGYRRLGADEDRSLDCQFSLEPIFDNVLRLALAAGWTEDDVAYALLELARTNIKGLIESRKTADAFACTRQMVAAMARVDEGARPLSK